MTLGIVDMEGGSNGANVTAALLGPRSPTNPVLDGGTVTFVNTSPYQGGLAVRTSYISGSSTGTFFYADAVAGSTLMPFEFAFRLNTDYAGATFATIAQYRTSSTPIFSFRIEWTAGVPALRFFVGATNKGQVGTGALSEAGTTWYRVTGEVNTTTGAYTARLRDGATDALIGSALTGTDAAITGSIEKGRFGVIGTVPTNLSIDFDWVGYNDGGTTELAAPTNSAPTVNAGADQNVGAAATVNLSATASDVDGTVASYAWTFDYPTTGAPSLTGASTANASFTSGSLGALYILRCTVTDNLGATAFDTVEVRVPVAGATSQRVLPGNGTGVGTWVNVGGAATVGAALTDESDTTYVESPSVSVTEQNLRLRRVPGNAKSGGAFSEKLWSDSTALNAVVRLYEGNTLRQTWNQAIPAAPGGVPTPVTYTFNLSSPTIAAITDWGNLYVEVGATT